MDSETAEVSIHGQRLTLSGGPHWYLQALQTMGWDTHPLLALAIALPPRATYLDVGANIGATTLAVATTRPDVRVIAFEPVPSNVAFLRRNIEANRIKNCTIVETAVGDTVSQVSMEENGPWSRVLPYHHAALSVPIISLDEYCSSKLIGDHIDLIKIDVGGYEPNVLAGAVKVMLHSRPTIFMEFNAWNLVLQGCNPAQFSRYLMESFDINPIPHVHKEDVLSLARENMVNHGALFDITMRPRRGALPLSSVDVQFRGPYHQPTAEVCASAASTSCSAVPDQPTKTDRGKPLGVLQGEGDLALVERIIEDIYKKIVLRPVDFGSMEYWRGVLRRDPQKLGELVEFLLRSDEFADVSRRFLHHYVTPERLPFINDNSQNGEIGILLREMIGRTVKEKFVVDVGAYGRSGSNSYDLMRHFGWRGLLIEPNPYLLSKIKEEFSGLDFRLVAAAATTYSGSATLHLGVGDENSSIHRQSTEQWGPVHEICTVDAERLSAILEANDVPREFGLLSIDTEGESSMVLLEDVFASGYRPNWVIMEVLDASKVDSLADIELAPEVKAEYRLVGRTFPNLIMEAKSASVGK